MSFQRIVYIISEVDKSLAFEWIAERLDRNRFQLTFFLIGKKNSALAQALKQMNVPFIEFPFRSKGDLLVIFFRIFFKLLWIRPQIVHTHLFYANLIGLTASWILRIKKRIFTRHHAMVHYREFVNGVKWDKWCNYTATHIVAISENVKDILITLDKASPEKIRQIPHGFDLHYFSEVSPERVENLKRQYKLHTHPVIGVIARFIELKGIQYIIPAFRELLGEYPQAHLVLANTNGNYASAINKLLDELPKGSFTTITFQNDLAALYRLFDVYVHVPVDKKSESFGQTYIEALASDVPSVFTLSGVAPEFIEHEKNALVIDYRNSDAIRDSVKRLLNDTDLRSRMTRQGRKSAEQFSIDTMIANLTSLYE
ncbi:MAG TPA: glycosyltransferase family 4 protein [Ohtaekwangia sp.]